MQSLCFVAAAAVQSFTLLDLTSFCWPIHLFCLSILLLATQLCTKDQFYSAQLQHFFILWMNCLFIFFL